MTKPLISVCIPVFNGEKYLKACLDSCVSQIYQNYEIIVCDDRSNDSSAQIIDGYVKNNKQIRFYKNEQNLGLVGNWNKCIELANGEWIKLMFQDDLMTANCLEKFVQQIGDSVKLIVCKRNFVLDEITSKDKIDYYENSVRTLENTGFYDSNDFDPKKISKIYAKNMSMNFIAEPSLTFFRKKIIYDIGFFDNELKQVCDLEFFLRASSNYGLKYLPEKLCTFRIHQSSTTERNMKSNNYYLMNLEGLHYALKVLSKKEFSNLRMKIGVTGNIRLKLYIKYHSYRAFRAIKTDNDKREFESLHLKYKDMMFRFFEIPFLRLAIALR